MQVYCFLMQASHTRPWQPRGDRKKALGIGKQLLASTDPPVSRRSSAGLQRTEGELEYLVSHCQYVLWGTQSNVRRALGGMNS